MNKELFQHFADYYDIYKAVIDGEKTDKEIVAYLINEKYASKSTALRHTERIMSEEPGMLEIDGSKIKFDSSKIDMIISEMYIDLGITPVGINSEVVDKLTYEVERLTEDNKKQSNIIDEQQNEIEKLKKQISTIKKDYDKAIRKYINEKLERKVVFAGNVDFEPKPEKEVDKLLLGDIPLGINVDKCISKFGGERKSFYDTSEVEKADSEKILNEHNYKSRIAKCIMGISFFRNWKHDIDNEKKFMDENGYKPIESKAMLKDDEEILNQDLSPLQRNIAESYIRKARAIYKIMEDDSLSNQMKLQLYARFSLAHGTQFEQLINYAADYNIDARWFVSVLNEAPIGDTYENMRDSLRVFAKASEAKQRMDFARELAEGVWHVVMDYDDEKNVPFVLVPAKEIDDIKKLVNDSNVVFKLPSETKEEQETKTKKTRKKRNVKKELVEAANKCPDINELSKSISDDDDLPKKPKYVDTYGMGKDDIDDVVDSDIDNDVDTENETDTDTEIDTENYTDASVIKKSDDYEYGGDQHE